MTRRKLCMLILCLPLMTFSQGINWTTGLTWEQVKQKAKQENKYIFLDCYTTWCGPCKMMDNSTYVNDSVGNYFNDKFISIRVQMDKTNKDDDKTREWYMDADSISKQYHVEGYPTLIFFKPDGNIIHKAMGFTPPPDFIAAGKIATTPGKLYDDAYADYDILVKEYKKGERNYDSYPFMIKMAFRNNDTAIGYQLNRELVQYVSTFPIEKRYTKEMIGTWAGIGLSSKGKVFNLFCKDGKQIDKVMDQKGYAAEVIDKTIQAEICIPFMEGQSKKTGIAMHGMYLNGPGLKSDKSEADWNQLYSKLKNRFGRSYAKRNVLTARIEWYARHRNDSAFVNLSLLQLKKYPPDLNKIGTSDKINDIGWTAFLKITDKRMLKQCIPWMEKLVKIVPNFADALDTYANLLYKSGRTKEAIEWEQKAALLTPGDKSKLAALEDMKRGKPTYIDWGAIWERVNIQ